MTKVDDVLKTGVFSRWRVLRRSGTKCNSNGYPFVVCKCSCGTIKDVRARDLLNGSSKSCGCRLSENLKSRNGDTNHRLFNTWSLMRIRCNEVNNGAYRYYGGVGIKVCERWDDNEEGFHNFLEDMESTFTEGLTLDRIDSGRGYSKGNCHWATKKQQANNLKSNKMLTVEGLTMTCSEWASLIGVNPKSLGSKLRREKIDSIGFDFKLPPIRNVYLYKGEVINTIFELIDRVMNDNPLATRHSYRSDKSAYMVKYNVKIMFLEERRTLEEVYNYLVHEDLNPEWVPEDSLYIKGKYKFYLEEELV